MSDSRKGTTNAGSFKKGERRSKKTEFKKGQIPYNKGKKGQIPWNKGKKGYANSGSFKKGITPWNKGKILVPLDDQRKKRNKTARKNYAKDLPKSRAKSRAFYQRHVEKEKERVRNYRIKNKGKIKAKALAVKIKVFTHYSKGDKISCCCCGFSEDNHEFYALDHIINKKAMGHTSHHKGGHLYNWAIKHEYPPGLQTLCHNCNQAKSDYGFCPHQKSK